MKYDLIFPVSGEFFMEEPPFEPDEEWMEPPLEQYFPGPEVLSAQEMAEYESEIDFFLHDVADTGQMQDNTGILKELDKDWLREKIEWVDLSVHTENGCLAGRLTINTKEPLAEQEDEALSAYFWKQFAGSWIETMQRKEIPVSGGIMKLRLEEPSMYQLIKEKKYEITDIAHPKYPWLHRIRALVKVNEQVGEGEYGGFIESESNLSQDGGCWIYDNAICCGEAVVEKEARMFDSALARDSALITGDSCLFDRASAEGHCCIRSGEIKEHARVAGDAVISEGLVDGLSPLVAGYSNVYGEVRGHFIIYDTILPGEGMTNPTEDLFILRDGKREVMEKAKNLEPPKEYKALKKQREKGRER